MEKSSSISGIAADIIAQRSELQTVESLVALMVVVTIVGMLARKIKLPYTVTLVLAGICIRAFDIVPKIKLTQDLLMLVFLPALLFEAAIHFPRHQLKKYASTIATLAAPGVVLTAVATALVLKFEFATFNVNQPIGFSHFLLFGAIIAATDPISVVSLLKQFGVSKKISTLIEGESLFNDGAAIVLYMIVLEAIRSGSFSVTSGLLEFFTVAAGGILIGTIMGLFASMMVSFAEDHLVSIALTTVTAYGTYLTAEELEVSGVLAVVVAGLFVGNIGKNKGMTPSARIAVISFWEYAAFFISSFVFLLIGLEVEIQELLNNLNLIALAFCAVLTSRFISVFLPLPILNKFATHITIKDAVVIWWGGLRGSLSMVLVLSLPENMPARAPLIAMTFGVVVISVVLQGTTMGFLLKILQMVTPRSEAKSFLGMSLAKLKSVNAQQKAIADFAPEELPGIQDLSSQLNAKKAYIIRELEDRYDDSMFKRALQDQMGSVKDYLNQVAVDSYRESIDNDLITEDEASLLSIEETGKNTENNFDD